MPNCFIESVLHQWGVYYFPRNSKSEKLNCPIEPAVPLETQTRRCPLEFRRKTKPSGGLPLFKPALQNKKRSRSRLVIMDWIELFIRNENILSPDSEISRNISIFTFFIFLQIFCNSKRILTFSHTSVKFRDMFIKIYCFLAIS